MQFVKASVKFSLPTLRPFTCPPPHTLCLILCLTFRAPNLCAKYFALPHFAPYILRHHILRLRNLHLALCTSIFWNPTLCACSVGLQMVGNQTMGAQSGYIT